LIESNVGCDFVTDQIEWIPPEKVKNIGWNILHASQRLSGQRSTSKKINSMKDFKDIIIPTMKDIDWKNADQITVQNAALQFSDQFFEYFEGKCTKDLDNQQPDFHDQLCDAIVKRTVCLGNALYELCDYFLEIQYDSKFFFQCTISLICEKDGTFLWRTLTKSLAQSVLAINSSNLGESDEIAEYIEILIDTANHLDQGTFLDLRMQDICVFFVKHILANTLISIKIENIDDDIKKKILSAIEFCENSRMLSQQQEELMRQLGERRDEILNLDTK